MFQIQHHNLSLFLYLLIADLRMYQRSVKVSVVRIYIKDECDKNNLRVIFPLQLAAFIGVSQLLE